MIEDNDEISIAKLIIFMGIVLCLLAIFGYFMNEINLEKQKYCLEQSTFEYDFCTGWLKK